MRDLPKLAIVVVVLATGVVAALPFHKGGQSDGTTADSSPDDLVLRRHLNLRIGPQAGSARPTDPANALPERHTAKPAQIRSPGTIEDPWVQRTEGTPELSDRFSRLDGVPPVPGLPAPPSTDTAQQGPGPPQPAALHPDRHTVMLRYQIVDGDSLPELAQRYLGDSRLYLEIYDLNRDVLHSPDLLPIGCEIKIPFPAAEDR